MCGGGGNVFSNISKSVTSAVSNPGNALKKIAAVNIGAASGVATGFLTGGPVGAIAGGVAGGATTALKVSKKGKAPAITLKGTVVPGATTGAIAGGVAGLARAAGAGLVHASSGTLTASGQVVPGFGEVASYNPSGGGFISTVGSVIGNGVKGAANWAMKGGVSQSLVNLGTSLITGAAGAAQDAPEALAAIEDGFSSKVPGIVDTAGQFADRTNKLLTGYNKFRTNLPNNIQGQTPDLSSVDTKIRDALSGFLRGDQSSPSSVTVNGPEASSNTPILLAGAVLLAFMFIKKR